MDEAMRRVDNKPIPNDRDEVRLFMVGIDSAGQIPYVLNHHFDIGVDRVFYIDNNSSDNSLEVLAEYDRVHVWSQHQPFSGAGTPAKSGAAWMEELMRRYAIGNWCLLADTDELFAYPGFKTRSIQDFIASLDGDFVRADFIDLYSDSKVKDTVVSGSFLETCPYTDKDGGSCRHRVLGFMPLRFKMPLFKYAPEIRVDAGFHTINGGKKLAGAECYVLHFKFTSVLAGKLAAHGHKMTQGKMKMQVYKDIGEVNFYDPEVSIRFEA